MFVLALQVSGCPREHSEPALVADATPAEDPALPSSLPVDAEARIDLLNGQRFGVQVYASQDAADTRSRSEALRARGLQAQIQVAELGERGTWHRVVLGDWSRRDLAELEGQRFAADDGARALLPTVPPGEPAYLLRDDLPAAELAPRVAAAVALAAAGRPVKVALARLGPGQPGGALVAVEGDARVRPVDASGTLGAPLPAPRYPGCADCVTMASAVRVKAVEIAFADDLGGDDASEVLVVAHHGSAGRLASLWTMEAGQARELVGFVLERREVVRELYSRFELVEADGDPRVELLLQQDSLLLHEGDLCDLQRRWVLLDLDGSLAPELDRARLAERTASGTVSGSAAVRALAALAADRHGGGALLTAAVGYLAHDKGASDLEAQKRFFEALDAIDEPGAPLRRVESLAALVTARPEFRITQAARLLTALDDLLSEPRVIIPSIGCDERPLARAGSWSGAQRDRHKARAQDPWDLRRLPPTLFAALAVAYGPDTPVGKKLETLVARLAPAPPFQAAVRAAMKRARQPGGEQ